MANKHSHRNLELRKSRTVNRCRHYSLPDFQIEEEIGNSDYSLPEFLISRLKK